MTVRTALFGDIHGNSVALDAVLADIAERGGVDAYVVLGDLCAIGGDPVGVLERVDALPNAACIRGNTDRYLLSGDLPAPPADNEQLRLMISGFRWSRDRVDEAGRLAYLESLPVEHRFPLPNGSALAVHASPGIDEGRGFRPDQTEEDCRELLGNVDDAVVIVGHTHVFVDRIVDGVRVFNPGSVSNHPPTEPNACYAILETQGDTYELTQHRVTYDKQKAIEALHASGFPAADYVASQIGAG